MEAGELWKHSVTTAVAAQLIASKVGDDQNVAFTAGLLHDIGKVILSNALEHTYAKLVEETEINQTALLETEKKLLGVHHAEIGGRLLARWKFPAPLVAAVWFHHLPRGAKPHDRLASCVYLADLISHFLGHGYGHQAFALRGRAEALEILELKPEDLPFLMIQTVENFHTVEALFQVGANQSAEKRAA
jgi:putative nucleotidyltransferase with HDIG domain